MSISSNNTNLSNIIDIWSHRYSKGLIWRSTDQCVYVDNPSVPLDQVRYDTPILDAGQWNQSKNNDKSASVNTDPLALSDVFFGPFADLANDYLADLHEARQTKDRSKAAAIITSTDYSILQEAVIIGETMNVIKTGVTAGVYPDKNVPTLKGSYLDWTEAVEFFTNVPEGKAVEPTKGSVTEVEYTIPKHQGAVAITERAQAVIHERDVFAKEINSLQQRRLQKENALAVAELENASNVVSGIDFGLRAGTPPYSSNSPENLFVTLVDAMDANGGTLNTIVSKNQAYNEALNNDFMKGYYVPLQPPAVDERVGPAPGLPGVTWYRDNAVVSATKLWAMDRTRALLGLRAGVRSFQVTEPKFESTEYVLKSYYLPKIVDQDFIREVTGVTA